MKLKEVKEYLGHGVSLEMLLIPAGTFMMGSPESEKGQSNDETQHEVTLTKPFYMGKYAVTQEHWEIVMGDNKSKKTNKSRLPATDVSWNDCQEFIKKLNAKTNGDYRLPTEAEWEYACRAGTISAYSYGDSITKNDANYYDGSNTNTKEVGSFKPNAFGLYEMHGNIWEWCEDWYGEYPAGAVTDPKGPAMGECLMFRGGSFYSNVLFVRSSNRTDDALSNRSDSLGFRLVKTP